MPVWKALGAWAVNEEQLLQFFRQSRGAGSRAAVSVLKVWQEETETKFRKENMAPTDNFLCCFVKRMLGLTYSKSRVLTVSFNAKHGCKNETSGDSCR